jgi:hypothetical protein
MAFPVRLAHLDQHVGLLDAFDNAAVLDPHVVEEIRLVGPFRRGSAVKTASGRAGDGAVREHHVAVGNYVVKLDIQVGDELHGTTGAWRWCAGAGEHRRDRRGVRDVPVWVSGAPGPGGTVVPRAVI